MADNDCCNSFGGRVTVTIAGTRYTPSEADITIEPANREVSAMANGDGSACYSAKPRLPSAEIKYRNGCGITWNELLLTCKVDVSIVEEDNLRTHIFSGARITGNPSLNISNGEVTGLKVEGANYQFLNG